MHTVNSVSNAQCAALLMLLLSVAKPPKQQQQQQRRWWRWRVMLVKALHLVPATYCDVALLFEADRELGTNT